MFWRLELCDSGVIRCWGLNWGKKNIHFINRTNQWTKAKLTKWSKFSWNRTYIPFNKLKMCLPFNFFCAVITRIFNWHLPLTPIKQLFSALISFTGWFQVGLRMGKLLSKQVRCWSVWWCHGSVRVQGGKPKLQAWEIFLWYVTSFLILLSDFSCTDWSGALYSDDAEKT